jgi:hypothetical protein
MSFSCNKKKLNAFVLNAGNGTLYQAIQVTHKQFNAGRDIPDVNFITFTR